MARRLSPQRKEWPGTEIRGRQSACFSRSSFRSRMVWARKKWASRWMKRNESKWTSFPHECRRCLCHRRCDCRAHAGPQSRRRRNRLRGNHCGQSRPRELRSHCRIIYTNPELAGVGLTEDQARSRDRCAHRQIPVPRPTAARFAAMNVEGMVKFVADAKTDRILGAQHFASYRFRVNR